MGQAKYSADERREILCRYDERREMLCRSDERREDESRPWRLCVVCERPLKWMRSLAITCSPACRRLLGRIKEEVRENESR